MKKRILSLALTLCLLAGLLPCLTLGAADINGLPRLQLPRRADRTVCAGQQRIAARQDLIRIQ